MKHAPWAAIAACAGTACTAEEPARDSLLPPSDMPKLHCDCGYLHDLSPVPDAGWITVRDAEYEALLEAEATRDRLASSSTGRSGAVPAELSVADRRVHELTGRLYECPRCGMLLWEQPGAAEFRRFRPVA